MGIKFHRNPTERRWFEKIARRFILPPHPPLAMAWDGWRKRESRLKSSFPIRFFIWETLPDIWNYKIRSPINRARNWVRFRTWDRYHIVDTGLEPNYYDPDHRMLHANFQILVDYVEIELAAMNLAMGDGDDLLENMSTNWKLNKFRKLFRKFRRNSERLPEEGLKHLDWEIVECKHSNPSQSESAKEKKYLYLWWTVWRNEREDPLSSPLIWDQDDMTTDLSAILKGKNRSQYRLSDRMETFYLNEDNEMLMRLVKIRNSLWT